MKTCIISILFCVAHGALALDPRPDLVLFGGEFQQKCKDPDPCYINKAIITVKNSGATDAEKSAFEIWVSDDLTLDASDTLLKRVKLGKIKAGTERKRKAGGKLFKQEKPTFSKTIFVVIDPDNVVDESNEMNTFSFS